MAKIYVSLILKGLKSYSDVPATIKEQVKELLIEQSYEEFVTE